MDLTYILRLFYSGTLLGVFLQPQDEDTPSPPATTLSPTSAPPPTTLDPSTSTPPPSDLEFPPTFKFGSASSAYQIEGAWNADGKGESIWDHLTHTRPDLIADGQNGDVAANSYYQYDQDIAALLATGTDFYRFSISWPRIMPDGDISSLNEAGLAYYDRLIDALLANGIQPMVTMYHWDLPQRLQELGGWTNGYIVDYFEQYARVLFARYADRVSQWITFNEPDLFCLFGYSAEIFAPMVKSPGIGEYRCGHNVLLANARAYHIYSDLYREQYGGKVGISLHTNMTMPANPASASDVAAADRSMQFWLGWFAHPIFTVAGGYPAVMKSTIDANSVAENRPLSRLPTFSAAEVESIKGTADFLGLNYYHSDVAVMGQPDTMDWAPAVSFYRDLNVIKGVDAYDGPAGFRALLKYK